MTEPSAAPSAQIGDTIDLTILDVVYRGSGLARHEGMVVFVPGVLKGEKVQARVIGKRKRFLEARLLEIIEPSPERVEPACPLAIGPEVESPCPGCRYQHASYEEELRYKHQQLSELLGHRLDIAPDDIPPLIPCPEPLGYRNRITLHERRVGGGRVLGYIGEDNESVVDVKSCPLAVPAINDLLPRVRHHLQSGRVEEEAPELHLFRWTAKDGAQHFTDRNEAKKPMTETTSVGTFVAPASSFFQVNPHVAPLLVDHVAGLLASIELKAVIDLYCGVGIFAAAAVKAGAEEVLGIDGSRDAIKAARANSQSRGDDETITFMADRAGPGLRSAMDRARPEEVTLIVDPPRQGLERDVRRYILAKPPARLIYISCAPDTLARDLADLKPAGYTIESIQALDMFPRTALFETVVSMSL